MPRKVAAALIAILWLHPPPAANEWMKDLGYGESDVYPLAIATTGCPFIPVTVGDVRVSLMLDTGTARGFAITTSAPTVPHIVEKRAEELNADGTHRGESLTIRVEKLEVLGKTFTNVVGSLSDWKMFSSVAFDGTVGLDFFLDRRVTLDYASRKVATTAAPLPSRLDPKRYIILDLVDAPLSQGHILYAAAHVNGRAALIYIDTGYSASFIDPAFAGGLERTERPASRFPVLRQHVPIDVAGHHLEFDDVRESPISRGPGLPLPVAVTLGSDTLRRFVVTIDLRAKKLLLAIP